MYFLEGAAYTTYDIFQTFAIEPCLNLASDKFETNFRRV